MPLTPAERAQAPAIYAALRAGVAALEAGERSAAAVRRVIRARLARAPLLRPEYVVLVDFAISFRMIAFRPKPDCGGSSLGLA
jgi:pantothenate synthetase